MESAVMARPKKKPVAAKKPSGAKPTALTIRGGLDWREWVERGADHCRTDVAKLVDAALIDYLKAKGFGEDPPKR
jgi:hypothetical protein